MGHFSGEKTRGDGYWVSRDSAHYKQRGFKFPSSQQRTIRSGRACSARNADSWHPNISSEPFAAGRPRPRALPALPPCLRRAPTGRVFCMGITLRKNWLEDASFATITTV